MTRVTCRVDGTDLTDVTLTTKSLGLMDAVKDWS